MRLRRDQNHKGTRSFRRQAGWSSLNFGQPTRLPAASLDETQLQTISMKTSAGLCLLRRRPIPPAQKPVHFENETRGRKSILALDSRPVQSLE